MSVASAEYTVTTTGSAALRNGWGPTATLECDRAADGTVVCRWSTTAFMGERSIIMVDRWTDDTVVRLSKELRLGPKVLTRHDFDPPIPLLELPPQPGATLKTDYFWDGDTTLTSTVDEVGPEPHMLRFTTVTQTPKSHDEETWWLDLETRLPVRAVWKREVKGIFGFSGKGEIHFERLPT